MVIDFEAKKGSEQMKSLLGVILIGLFIFSHGEVWGADWKLYFFHENIWAYYDAQSITRPSKNIVRVWTRGDFTEKGVIDYVGDFGEKYENLSHLKDLLEINCLEKMIRGLSMTIYDSKGKVIDFFSSPLKWDFIIPESRGESLYKEVCK
jgi:hypothetical protein